MAQTDAGGRHAEPKLGTTRSWWHRRGLVLVIRFLQDDSQTNGDLVRKVEGDEVEVEGDEVGGRGPLIDGAVYTR